MLRALLSIPALLLWLFPARAEPLEVDIELFLAVDVSRSMSPRELEIQRRGYAEALSSPRVIEAITGGMIGRIALTYVEWAGNGSQTVVIPWTLIDDAGDARAISEQLTAFFSDSMRRTSISEALIYAANSFDLNDFNGLRRVIDISGDGPNNQGRPVLVARDEVVSRRITINGLPLMTVDEISLRWGIPDLDVYYTNCVIGGPGAFVLPVLSWDQFAEAVERKLVLEISNRMPERISEKVVPVQGYDCLIGEKIWRRNQSDFFMP
jgi:hypothetical protein